MLIWNGHLPDIILCSFLYNGSFVCRIYNYSDIIRSKSLPNEQMTLYLLLIFIKIVYDIF